MRNSPKVIFFCRSIGANPGSLLEQPPREGCWGYLCGLAVVVLMATRLSSLAMMMGRSYFAPNGTPTITAVGQSPR